MIYLLIGAAKENISLRKRFLNVYNCAATSIGTSFGCSGDNTNHQVGQMMAKYVNLKKNHFNHLLLNFVKFLWKNFYLNY